MKKLCNKCGGEKVRVGKRWKCRPCEREYQRKHYQANREHSRAVRNRSQKKRRHDPETRAAVLACDQRAWHNGGSEKRKAWMRRIKTENPWQWKALTVHTSLRGTLSGDDLRLMFLGQDGKCGLTGQPLRFNDMQLDHKMPRSRGGDNSFDNLRWVCREANQAKHSLTDDEFLTLCTQVAQWIGERILEANDGQ